MIEILSPGARRRRLFSIGIVLTGVVSVATPVRAQEAPAPAPTPTARPIDAPIAGGQPIPRSAATPQDIKDAAAGFFSGRWDYNISAGEAWQLNPDVVPGDTSQSAFVDSVDAGLSFRRRSARSQFSLAGGGQVEQFRYQEGDVPNRNWLSGNGSIMFTQQLSPRTSMNLAEAIESTDASNSSLLVESGLLYRRVRTLTSRASGGLTQLIGSHSSVLLNVRHEYVNFNDPLLLDGSQLAPSATITRQGGPGKMLGASYLFQFSQSGPNHTAAHTLFGSWSGTAGQRWTAAAALGGSRVASTGIWEPYAVFEVTSRLPRGDFYLRGSHNVSQAYGLGTQMIATIVTAGLRHRFARRFETSFSLAYDRSRALSANAVPFQTTSAQGSARVGMTKHVYLSVSGYYTLRKSEAPGIADTTTAGAGLSVAYLGLPR